MSFELLESVLDKGFSSRTVSPYNEILAFEQLYSMKGSSAKKIAEQTVIAGKLPSEVLKDLTGFFDEPIKTDISAALDKRIGSFSALINLTPSWPKKLIASARPTPVLYYKGDIGLLESKSVSIVGARKASAEGISRAFKLARTLASEKITVVTGLANGIDTAALKGAIKAEGRMIGVIGTPIDEYYPKENRELQDYVASRQLLLSQVPFYKYSVQPFSTKRHYFPERNELMAAVSDATVIVEASDTSGSLSQARACLKQGRPLFITRSCAQNSSITWPSRFIGKEGVYVLDDVEQIVKAIKCR